MVAKRPTILLFVVLLLGALCSYGQTEQFKFKRLDLKDGLSHSTVWSIFKDQRGFIWIGTAYGLNRFDGYTIKSFLHDPRDSMSLPADGIYRVFETPENMLGVVTSAGLTLYDRERDRFQRQMQAFFERYGTSDRLFNIVRDPDGSFWFVEAEKLIKYFPDTGERIVIEHIPSDSSSILPGEITDFTVDSKQNHWLVHANGIAEKVEVKNRRGVVVQRIFEFHNQNKTMKTTCRVLSDADGDVWLYAPPTDQGVFLYRTKENQIEHLSTEGEIFRLNSNSVSDVVQDDSGLVWIGSDHGGINIVDKEKKLVQYILHHEGDETSLAANSVICLYKDDQGIVWTGAYKLGVSYYHPSMFKFKVYKHYSTDPSSLPFEDINGFAEDRHGNLWIGTNGGGLIYFDRQRGTFKQYLHDPGNSQSLSGNVVVSLCVDSENNLWIGTYKAGLNKFDGRKFTRFRNIPGDTTSLPSMNVWEVFEDSRNNLWIGTVDAGAALLDKGKNKFHKLRVWGPNAMQSVTIEAINEDKYGNVWFGTTKGIDVLSKDFKTFTHYDASSVSNSLSSNSVFDINRDAQGRIWVATADGLNLFDEAIGGFRIFKEKPIGNAVLSVRDDNQGNVWMSTLNGLTRMTLVNGSIDSVTYERFTEMDGLQGRQFNINAAFKTSAGQVVFGGPAGFNISNGVTNREKILPNRVIFSDFELFEEPVGIGEIVDGVVILNKAISEATEIVLPPNKNFFSLKFSALNYFNPERDRYSYKLEGLSSNWLSIDSKSHEVVFNTLNPGKYVLRIRTANAVGEWSEKEAVLSIIVQPPFWKTEAAFVLYAVIMVIIMIMTRKVIQQREQMKFAIEQERREMQRVHELDVMKVKFFTNVSHEFRTPLTLILTPIERLVKKTKDPELQAQFQVVYRNGKRLMNLVNQLLDFKKLEVHEIKLNASRGDLVAFVRETVLSFSDLSEKKNIKLLFYSSADRIDTLFDHDKLEKILFNLLGNAFKFTLENGVVSVKVDILLEGNERLIQIDVSDTGIGIPQDKLDKIFEPFFQTDTPKSVVNQGSGIGLSITKEFVRIHGGRIEVKSEAGHGSSFKVLLPLREIPTAEIPLQMEEIGSTAAAPVVAEVTGEPEKPNTAASQKSLLLIEDNDDFRFYLRDNLKFQYNIYEARNGAEGWNQVLSLQPDLIVSDIMMPEMNGIELCNRIKGDERVSHIPIILLTARSSEEQRIEGFKTGADDYITKPFNFEVLEARINNLLSVREKFQKNFRKTLDVKSSELQITPLDVKLIEKAVKVVEENISSPTFSIEDFGMELGISRAYVFKKILALTGKTPLEFIRTIRLQHAAQLLEKSQLSVREIAYKVGFNTPKYFTKYFKEQYHMLPSEYAASKRSESEST